MWETHSALSLAKRLSSSKIEMKAEQNRDDPALRDRERSVCGCSPARWRIRGLSASGTVKSPKALYLLPYFTVPSMAQGQWLDAGTPSDLESGFSTL